MLLQWALCVQSNPQALQNFALACEVQDDKHDSSDA
jgi:hypothetical protein